MLQTILQHTKNFIAQAPKEDRKQYGQFFTSDRTAQYMAQMFQFDLSKPEVKLLDAGAGTGILSAAAVWSLMQRGYKGKIHPVCYENDTKVIPILINNLAPKILKRINTLFKKKIRTVKTKLKMATIKEETVTGSNLNHTNTNLLSITEQSLNYVNTINTAISNQLRKSLQIKRKCTKHFRRKRFAENYPSKTDTIKMSLNNFD